GHVWRWLGLEWRRRDGETCWTASGASDGVTSPLLWSPRSSGFWPRAASPEWVNSTGTHGLAQPRRRPRNSVKRVSSGPHGTPPRRGAGDGSGSADDGLGFVSAADRTTTPEQCRGLKSRNRRSARAGLFPWSFAFRVQVARS